MGLSTNRLETTPRAFISYARSDGEETAAWLRARLEKDHPEITLWLDRARMVGGLGWWKQVTDALDRVEILIMVLTPGATRADIAAKEWRYARQQGVRICPVTLNATSLEFGLLPGWVHKVHCYDLNREWETFIGYLHSPGKVNRVPFMAPDVPEKCVERPVELEALLEQLLDDSRKNPLAVTTALHGAGGFGKTTLACMLCHHEEIISAFDDGILWVTLGQTPNIQGELTKIYAALTGDRPPFVDIDDASIQLSARLESNNCLLVIDDVWDPNHLKPFLRGGIRCSRLITTRQLSVVSEAGMRRTSVDQMTEAEALQMLLVRIPPSSGELGKLQAIAERLGRWPLLLKLAGSQLSERMERGDTLQGALGNVGRALDKRGVVAFDRAGRTDRNDAVARTVAASLERFSAGEQLHCTELAIFRDDSAFPLGAASALWGLDEFDAEALMLRLADAGLLEFDLKIASVRIHNVLRAYFESRLASSEAVHMKLISRWLGNRYSLPDAYAWTWIGWHLTQARQFDQLKALLLDFDWLRARLSVVTVQIVLQDFKFMPDSDELSVMRDALLLASAGLTLDSGQLRVQLWGRIERGRFSAMDSLLDRADKSEPRPRLKLADSSLTHPGGAVTAILKSHLSIVEALAMSPGNGYLVSGSSDRTLRLWDLETNSVLRTFEGHRGAVHAVAFAPDALTLLSASEDRTLRLWDVATGKLLQTLTGHTLAALGVAIAADGKLAYSTSEDGTVREWNLATRQTRTLFKGHNHQLGPIAVTADGLKLIFSAGDSTIQIMDLANSATAKTLEGHAEVVHSLAISPDDSVLVSAGEDGLVRAWALETGIPIIDLEGHGASVRAVAFAGDARRVISGSFDRTLRLWDLDTGKVMRVLTGHSGFVRAIAVNAATGRVFSGSTDCSIRCWNVDLESIGKSANEHAVAVARLLIASDGTRAASGTGGSEMLVWAVGGTHNQTPVAIGSLEGHADRIHAIDLSIDGKWAVTGSRDRTLRIWDLGRMAEVHVLKGHVREVLDVQISAKGGRIASFSRDRTARIWDLETGRAIRVLVSEDNDRARASLVEGSAMLAELETDPVIDLCAKSIPQDANIWISPDGNFAMLGAQGSVHLWDLREGTTVTREVRDIDVVALAFAPDSRSVVIGSLVGTLMRWEFGKNPTPLEGHKGVILDIIVTPDGKRAVSASSDDTIRVWDLDAGRQQRVLQGRIGHADAVAIAPNGNFAYTVYGHTVVVYDLLSVGRRIGSLTLDHQITAISVTPHGRRAVIGDLSGRVHFLDVEI